MDIDRDIEDIDIDIDIDTDIDTVRDKKISQYEKVFTRSLRCPTTAVILVKSCGHILLFLLQSFYYIK